MFWFFILFMKICLFILWDNYRTETTTHRLEVHFCVKGYQHTFWSSLTRCVALLSASMLLGLPFRLIEGLVFGLSTLHCDFTPVQFLATQSNSFVQVFSIGKVNIAKPWTENNAVYQVKKQVVQDHPKTCGRMGKSSLMGQAAWHAFIVTQPCVSIIAEEGLHQCWCMEHEICHKPHGQTQATKKQGTTTKSIPLQVTVMAMPVLFNYATITSKLRQNQPLMRSHKRGCSAH